MEARGSKAHEGPPQDEVQAIIAVQNGDRDAYGLIVRRYASRAVGVARAILRDSSLAEDAAQEAFVRGFRAIHRFRTTEPFYPWLYRILKNVCLTKLKRRSRRKGEFSIDTEDSPPLEGPPSDPSGEASKKELRATIDAAMAKLSDPHREILHLSHFEELSYKEIAACLDIPIGTVMSRLWAARKALKKVLGPALEPHHE
ncbi:MAG: RNA polymerase sigma factor [Planctomycetota bacterium]|jgi:RNA polymerase sigma-70 factor (ECF subfamily)